MDIFIKNIDIRHVRHLKDVNIPVTDDSRLRHLILTGRNGSGKTSLLEAIAGFLDRLTAINNVEDARLARKMIEANQRHQKTERYSFGIQMELSVPMEHMYEAFKDGKYVVAFYGAHRKFRAQTPSEISKVEIKNYYTLKETPREEFLKYMLDLKMMQALAIVDSNKAKAQELTLWFDRLTEILRGIYEDDTLTLEFDQDKYLFYIHTRGHEPFDFNSASDGFSAILDIVADLMMRMQKPGKREIDFTTPGIVLIDEVENHLHLSMQRNVFGYLEKLFPNVQFIVSTHSPFVLNSAENAVIYDLENRTLVKDGLSNVTYSGIVESYFKADELSEKLREKFEQYKKLVNKKNITDEDLVKITAIEMYLNEMPDYLQLGIATDYKRLKLEFRQREDL